MKTSNQEEAQTPQRVYVLFPAGDAPESLHPIITFTGREEMLDWLHHNKHRSGELVIVSMVPGKVGYTEVTLY